MLLSQHSRSTEPVPSILLGGAGGRASLLRAGWAWAARRAPFLPPAPRPGPSCGQRHSEPSPRQIHGCQSEHGLVSPSPSRLLGLAHAAGVKHCLARGKPGLRGAFAFLPPKAAFCFHLPTIPKDSTVRSAGFMLGVGCRGRGAAASVTDCPLRVCDGSGTALCPFYRGTALAVFAEAMT